MDRVSHGGSFSFLHFSLAKKSGLIKNRYARDSSLTLRMVRRNGSRVMPGMTIEHFILKL
jgi:hypothetical protein